MCLQVEGVESQDVVSRKSEEMEAWNEEGAAKARLDAGGTHAGLLGGSPLTLLQGIIPGILSRSLPLYVVGGEKEM